METICAFSSDSRELYKADIYRVLALPNGHIVHFRYKKKYVGNDLLLECENLKNRKVVIFFTHGNLLDASDNTLTHVSIRWATISHAEISNETGVFHVYMKLNNFCDVSVNIENSEEHQPPTKFLSSINCTERNEKNSWQHRVDAVKDYFDDMTFFHLKGIFSGRCPWSLAYQNNGKSCHYNLIHGDRYIVKLSLGNPKTSQTKIEISDSSEEITINCINPIETSVQFDDFEIPISVKSLETTKQASLLSFRPCHSERDNLGEYATNIELNLELGLERPVYFGLLSTVALGAFLIATSIVDIEDSVEFSEMIPILALSLAAFACSAGLLFAMFNKK